MASFSAGEVSIDRHLLCDDANGIQEVRTEEVLAPGGSGLRAGELPLHLHAVHQLLHLGRLGTAHLLLSLRCHLPVRVGQHAGRLLEIVISSMMYCACAKTYL